MTRGQNSLVIDASESSAADAALLMVDFAAFDLQVIAANSVEAAAHDAMLVELDRASAGKTLWKTLVA